MSKSLFNNKSQNVEINRISDYHFDSIIDELLDVVPDDKDFDKQYFIDAYEEQNLKVLDVDGMIYGFLELGLFETSVHINMIGINPKQRGKGLSKHLMKALANKSAFVDLYEDDKVDNIKYVTLEVSSNNTNAIILYLKYGYKIVGFIQNYYDNESEGDAVYMRYTYE